MLPQKKPSFGITTQASAATALLLSCACLAQPLTPQGPTRTETPPNIADIIAQDAKWASINRWRIQSDVQTKIFETTQDVTVNKARTPDKASREFERFINDGSNPIEVSRPKLTTSGKVTTTPAPIVPTPSGTPAIEIFFRIFLFGAAGMPREGSPSTMLWSTELSFAYSGYGEWTLFGESAPSAFTTMIEPGAALDVVFELELRYDTSTTADDVRFLFETGGNPLTELPELAFDMQLLVVPAPPIMSLAGMALLVSSRRRRVRS
jgi:hypothetical protein